MWGRLPVATACPYFWAAAPETPALQMGTRRPVPCLNTHKYGKLSHKTLPDPQPHCAQSIPRARKQLSNSCLQPAVMIHRFQRPSINHVWLSLWWHRTGGINAAAKAFQQIVLYRLHTSPLAYHQSSSACFVPDSCKSPEDNAVPAREKPCHVPSPWRKVWVGSK